MARQLDFIKPPSRKIVALVRRSLREKAKGGQCYDRSREAITKARNLGLQVNQPVKLELPNEHTGEIETRTFILQDNFAGDKAGRNVVIPHYELVKLPKTSRKADSAEQKEVA